MFKLKNKPIPALGALLRKYFFAGVLVVAPFAVIAWILGAALGTLWRVQNWLPSEWRPESYLNNGQLVLLVKVAITVALLMVLALGTSLIGWSSRQILGQKFLDFLGELISHIPVLRSVYSALDQLLKTLAQGGDGQFNRVVYIEYPRTGVYALAFVTGPARGIGLPQSMLNVYVPTTPNPTSGFHLIIAESETRDSGLSVEDAFRTILSLGIAQGGGPRG